MKNPGFCLSYGLWKKSGSFEEITSPFFRSKGRPDNPVPSVWRLCQKPPPPRHPGSKPKVYIGPSRPCGKSPYDRPTPLNLKREKQPAARPVERRKDGLQGNERWPTAVPTGRPGPLPQKSRPKELRSIREQR